MIILERTTDHEQELIRKPELRVVRNTVDLDRLVQGDKIIIKDIVARPSLYVSAFAGRISRESDGSTITLLEFVSLQDNGKLILLETVNKKAVAYNGDGSVSFNVYRGYHFQEELGQSVEKKDYRYLALLRQAGL